MAPRDVTSWLRRAVIHGAAASAAMLVGVAEGKDAAIGGAELEGFGRISLEFGAPAKVVLRNTGGVLVIGLGAPVTSSAERLAAEMPSYVAVARRDPDGRAIRLGLARPVRAHVLEAGEKVFVDLLPEDWMGLPPGLPQEVVDRLSRRALAAEARLREGKSAPEAPTPRGVVRAARMRDRLRLTFQVPPGIPASFSEEGRSALVGFSRPVDLDLREVRGRLEPALTAVAVENGPTGPRVRLTPAEGYAATPIREEEGLAVLVAPAGRTAPSVDEGPAGASTPAAARPTPPEVKIQAAAPPQPGPELETKQGAVPVPPGAATPRAESPRAPSALAPPPPGPVRPILSAEGASLRLAFRFARPTAAAAFERAGVLTLAFETAERIELPAGIVGAAGGLVHAAAARREGGFAIVRLGLARPEVAQLVPDEGGWVLDLGEAGLPVARALAPTRIPDESGRASLVLPLPGASGVHWLEAGPDGGGERIGVVTAHGPAAAVAKPHTFQELSLFATAHGAAILARADDLSVRTQPGRLVIARAGGLSLSLEDGKDGPASFGLALDRDRWREDRGGHAQARMRDALRAAAEAAGAQRGPLRLGLARLYLANGLAAEATGALAAAAADDPTLLRQPRAALLQGIAALRSGRDEDARRVLTADTLGGEPEAGLWVAVLDARAGRWPQALAGFKRASAILERYPDDIRAELALVAAGAGIEADDPDFARAALSGAVDLQATDAARARHALLAARLEERAGRTEAALRAFRELAGDRDPAIAAESTLRFVEAALAHASMPRDEAIARLEMLAVAWRGDAVEALTIARLGRLYAEAGRWREAFGMTRLANRMFPDHPATRQLHGDTARLFEELFLGGRGQPLPRVEALALYFDFKEFTPIGRVGDEIVRHLADRLVELDLLDEAGDLLQHQVDNRLGGAARATVAARLATIRLMAGKPQAALAGLRATWLAELPEDLKRARLLLEARALSDTRRTDLALDLLAGEGGPEVDRLRADILWSARRWREAGEAQEIILGSRWREPGPLSDKERGDVMRAGVAYALAGESLSLDRLRLRFGAKMAAGEDARTFAFLTMPGAERGKAAAALAPGMTSAASLGDFLAAYRRRYPQAAAAARPERASPESDTGAPPQRGG